jgi:hypothetical protein
MKKLIIAFTLLVGSFSSMAHVLEVSEAESISGPVVERANLKFNQCDNFRINELERSTKVLSNTIDQLQGQVEKYKTLDLTKKENKFLKQVSNTLSCVKKKITEKLTFKCQQNSICDTAVMYVQRIILVPSKLQKNTIHACDSSFYYDSYGMAGVILHEASHLCGTNDIEYLLEHDEYNSEPQLSYDYRIKRKSDGLYLGKRLFAVKGAKNADSYRYWYHYGFCLPGRDC